MATQTPLLQPGRGPIGVFDSGYGGLTILRQIQQFLPQYDYLYLGDNARAPYGSRSFDVIYRYTLEAVEALFQRGCQLVILACNTASAKALRSIQMLDLQRLDPRAARARRDSPNGGSRVQTDHFAPRRCAGHSGHHQFGLVHTWKSTNWPRTSPSRAKPAPCGYRWWRITNLTLPVPTISCAKRIDGIMRLDPQIDTLILGCTHYPLLDEQNREVCANWRAHRAAGRIRRRQPQGLSATPPRHRRNAAPLAPPSAISPRKTLPEFRESAALFMHQNVEVEQIDFSPSASCVHILYIIYISYIHH